MFFVPNYREMCNWMHRSLQQCCCHIKYSLWHMICEKKKHCGYAYFLGWATFRLMTDDFALLITLSAYQIIHIYTYHYRSNIVACVPTVAVAQVHKTRFLLHILPANCFEWWFRKLCSSGSRALNMQCEERRKTKSQPKEKKKESKKAQHKKKLWRPSAFLRKV